MAPLSCASLNEIYPELNNPEKIVEKTFKENDKCINENKEYQNKLKKEIIDQNQSIKPSNILETMAGKIVDYGNKREYFSFNDNIINLLEQLILIGKIIIVILIILLIKK